MPSVDLTEETLILLNQEATATGVDPATLIDHAIRDIRLRRELQKGKDSMDAGQVGPLDLKALKARVKQTVDARRSNIVED